MAWIWHMTNHPQFKKIQPNNSLPEALETLGNQHLLRRTLSVGKGAEVQPQTLREIELEKFMTHGSWRRSTAHLWGSHREVKADCRQRGGRTWWICPSAWVEGFGAPGLSPDWSTWTPKSGFWSTSWEIYLKGTQGKALGGLEQRSPRPLGEGHNRNSPVFVTLHVLQGGRGSGPGSQKLPGHTAWMLRHQYYKAV